MTIILKIARVRNASMRAKLIAHSSMRCTRTVAAISNEGGHIVPQEIQIIGAQVAVDDLQENPVLRAQGIAKRLLIIDGPTVYVLNMSADAAEQVANQLRPSGIVIANGGVA